MRFTHANRHCPDHPYATLTRSDDFVLKPVSENTDVPHDVTRWFERYKMSREREDRTPTGKNERKKTWKSTAENHKRVKSRKGLMMDTAGEQENLDRKPPSQRLYCGESQDSQEESQDEDAVETCTILQMSEDEEAPTAKSANAPLRTPLDRLQPKKRWLREACLEQQLARPLNWDFKHDVIPAHKIDEKHTLNESADLSELRWNVSSALDMHKESVEPNLQSDTSSLCYISTELCCDMNLNKESPKVAMIKQENAYDITHVLNQPQWDSSLNDASNLSNNLQTLDAINQPALKIQDSTLDHLHWDSSPANEISTSNHHQLGLDMRQYTDNETVNQNILVKPRINENETRPTVLMLAGSSNNVSNKDTKLLAEKVEVQVKQEDNINQLPIQEDNKKWLGALALMELANNKTQEELTTIKHDGS